MVSLRHYLSPAETFTRSILSGWNLSTVYPALKKDDPTIGVKYGEPFIQGDLLSYYLSNFVMEVLRRVGGHPVGTIFCHCVQLLAHANDIDIIGHSSWMPL